LTVSRINSLDPYPTSPRTQDRRNSRKSILLKLNFDLSHRSRRNQRLGWNSLQHGCY